MERTIPVSGKGPGGATGLCLEPLDLAASKLAAYREKDLRFVRTLLIEGMIGSEMLRERIATLPVETSVRDRILRWIDLLQKSLSELEA